jgi:hypothetical protein
MNDYEEMEKKLQNLSWQTPAQVDRKILADAERVLKTNNFFRRNLMMNLLSQPWRKAAGMAAMIGILVLIYFIFTESPALTLAQVQSALKEQTWVHVKYDNGREEWTNLRDGQFFFKDVDGFTMFTDYAQGVRYDCWPESGKYISEIKIPASSSSPQKYVWNLILDSLDKYKSGSASKAELQFDVIDGRRLARFESFTIDGLGKRVIVEKTWVDPETRLPVRVWRYLSLAEREEQKRESITGNYDFPVSGPSSIYDLGVSRDLEIVKKGEKTKDPSVIEILEAGKKAYKNFPQKVRIINYVISRAAEIDIIYRNDLKYRGERFFNFIPSNQEYQKYHINPTATPDQVLEWSRNQIPVSIHVGDGQKEFSRNNRHPGVSNSGETTVRVLRFDPRHPIPFADWPPRHQWTYAIAGGLASFELLTSSPDLPPGCIALRQTAGDDRRDYYIDPAHDYSEVKEIGWKRPSGNWEKDWEYSLSDFTQLATGQWYAAKLNEISYPDAKRGTSRGDTTWRIDIRTLEESEFPTDAFNGEKLLQGAKIQTY